MPPQPDQRDVSGWFAGPKAENGEWFADTIRRIVQDYHSWRRNYFPEDGVVLDSSHRRHNEAFQDAFEDRLIELLARLKSDFPFHSPRYAAHMLAEQSLPSIAGYFAAMLYNPNNVTADAAPVTVRLELEAARMISRMLGYADDAWAHLTSGGTVANLEALWVARAVKYLPFVLRDVRQVLGLPPAPWSADAPAMLRLRPAVALSALAECFADARRAHGDTRDTTARLLRAFRDSSHNVAERGLAALRAAIGSDPVVLAPETHHYCFEKAMDVLGFGRRALVSVRVAPDFRMSIEDLERQLDLADRQGRHVVSVVAVVGSTEEGAVDPVHEILDLRARRESSGRGSFWLHADAAYGGYLRTILVPQRLGLGEPVTDVRIAGQSRRVSMQLPEHGACDALARLGECDSITIDPHKLGYIPYPAGAVCFRSNLVKPIARQEAPYLEEAPSDAEAERASEAIGVYILEGSKPGAAAAAVWLSHALIPLDNTGHGVLIQETIRNACELHALLEFYPTLADERPVRAVCLCPPGSNIVCYAFRPEGARAPLATLNTLNRRVHARFSPKAGERVYGQPFFVSRTTLSPSQYSESAVGPMLERLGATPDEYRREGVFLLRSVLMNPWYAEAKRRGRYFLSELAGALYQAAEEEWGTLSAGAEG